MADNPYDLFSTPAAPDPYAAFSAPAQKGPPPVPAIDVSLPRAEVRAQLAGMPPDVRQQALKAWADAKVKAERTAESGTLMGRLANTDASRQYVSGGFGGVVGPWLDEINAGVQTGMNAIRNGSTEGAGQYYDEAKALEEARRRAIESENTKLFNVPGVDRVLGEGAGDITTGTLRKIAGGVMTLPITPGMRGAGAGAGRAAVPMAAPAQSVLSQIVKSVPVTAIYGGIAGLGEGDALDERAKNAAAGTALGVAAGIVTPPLARGVGNVAGSVGSAVRGTPPEVASYSKGAVDRVSRAVIDDRLAGSAAVPAAEETMLADMGPNLRGQAGALANQPGEAQSTIVNALEGRRAGAAERINRAVDRSLGPAQNLVDLESSIKTAQSARAKPFYEAFEQAPIPMTPKLADVMQRADAAGALKKAQRLMDIEGPPQTEAKFYDYVKRGIDDMAGDAKPGSNEARMFAKLARDLRETIDDTLMPGGPSSARDIIAHLKAGGTPDQVSPWAMARYHSGEGLQFADALAEGGKAFSRGTHPDQLRADMASMTVPERLGYTAGARGQVRDTIGNAASALRQNGDIKAMQQLGSEYARDKLDQIALPGTAKNLTGRLDAEAKFADTYNQVTQNSKTASRQAAQQEFPTSAEVSKTPDLTHVTATGLGVQAARQAVDALRSGALTAKQVRIAADAAKLLVKQGAERDAVINGLISFAQSKQASVEQKRAAEYIAYAVGRMAITQPVSARR